MFKYIAVLALILPFVVGVNFKKCSNGLPIPDAVEVEGCELSPCSFQHGSVANLYMTFTSSKLFWSKNQKKIVNNIILQSTDSTGWDGLYASVVAIVFGIRIPYTLPPEQSAVCNRLIFGTCPLDEQETAVYHTEMPILQEYPSGLNAEFELTVSQPGTILDGFCFGFGIKIL